jgi:hypothetical protein
LHAAATILRDVCAQMHRVWGAAFFCHVVVAQGASVVHHPTPAHFGFKSDVPLASWRENTLVALLARTLACDVRPRLCQDTSRSLFGGCSTLLLCCTSRDQRHARVKENARNGQLRVPPPHTVIATSFTVQPAQVAPQQPSMMAGIAQTAAGVAVVS